MPSTPSVLQKGHSDSCKKKRENTSRGSQISISEASLTNVSTPHKRGKITQMKIYRPIYNIRFMESLHWKIKAV
jgi:hypothetical protein